MNAKFHGNFMIPCGGRVRLVYSFDDVNQYIVHIDCEGVVMQFSLAIISW